MSMAQDNCGDHAAKNREASKHNPERFAEIWELKRKPNNASNDDDRQQDCVHGTQYMSQYGALS